MPKINFDRKLKEEIAFEQNKPDKRNWTNEQTEADKQTDFSFKGPSINDVTPKFGFFDPPPSPCHPMSPLAL